MLLKLIIYVEILLTVRMAAKLRFILIAKVADRRNSGGHGCRTEFGKYT